MTPDWLTFLAQAGAVLDDGRLAHFGNPERELRAALQGDILCDLSRQGLIAVSGEDAQTFLQGQLINDIRQVTPEHSQLSAYCSPKGRMLANFRIFQRDEAYYLHMPQEKLEPILRRLKLFILRAKVTLEDASDKLVHIGLSGPRAEALLSEASPPAPAGVGAAVQTQGLTVIRVPGDHPRYEVYGPLAPMETLWTELASQTIPAGAEPWRLLDILAGIPIIYTATTEAFVPQMANLQLLDGISFRKGCYTGQEIVARTHYLGTLKRRMYRAHVDTERRPPPGTELFSAQSGAGAGKIVDACRHPEGGYETLAVVIIDSAENGPVRLHDEQGPQLRFAPLPYAFAEDENQEA